MICVCVVLCIVGSSKLGGLINHFVSIGMLHDVLHCKSLACICMSLQNGGGGGRRVYVNLNSCSRVTIDPIVHEIHYVYILLVND